MEQSTKICKNNTIIIKSHIDQVFLFIKINHNGVFIYQSTKWTIFIYETIFYYYLIPIR